AGAGRWVLGPCSSFLLKKRQACAVKNLPAKGKTSRRPPICLVSITLLRSPVSLSPGDEVPHIFTRLLHCRVCKEPLAATDGEYALKYFLVEKANKRNSVIRKAAKLDQAGLIPPL